MATSPNQPSPRTDTSTHREDAVSNLTSTVAEPRSRWRLADSRTRTLWRNRAQRHYAEGQHQALSRACYIVIESERLSRAGQSVKAKIQANTQSRKADDLLPEARAAGQYPTHRDHHNSSEYRVALRRTLGSVRIILLAARRRPAAGTLRFIMNRPAARLRPPLIDFEVVMQSLFSRCHGRARRFRASLSGSARPRVAGANNAEAP